MLKGINKRVIVIKNLNSDIIEEAYFILKNGKGIFKAAKENGIVTEANKIISEYHSQQRQLADKSDCSTGNSKELDKFLHPQRDEKDEKEINYSDTAAISSVSNLADLSDEEIFEDSKIFEHMQGTTVSKDYFHDLDFHSKNLSGKHFKSVLNFKPSKKTRTKKLRVPPKSFFAGIGVMSAIIIAIKLIEYMMGI